MSEEESAPTPEPVAEVGSELSIAERQLRALAATQPLWSAALSAQMRESISALAAQAFPSGYMADTLSHLARQIAAVNVIDTKELLASIQGAIGYPGLRDALQFNFDPGFRALTSPKTYATPDPPKSIYSDAMTSPGAFFAKDESEIESFDDLNSAIAALITKTRDLRLVWRGHRDAEWGIHSALFRRLMNVNGVKPPEARPAATQPYPDEDQVIRAEREILRVARTDWRFDGLSALETFARIQHAGGPTRLLDVTKNPFVAAWFAVEAHEGTQASDGRLIAFATTPVLGPGGDAALVDSQVGLDEEWGDRTPPWHRWNDTTARQAVDWGTGARRRLWVPPAYDPRISAQNAAFLLDGVPITARATQPYFKSNSGPPATYWTRADILAAASIYARTHKANRRPRSNQHNFAPTFTFRIKAAAKEEIRDFLVSRFGYTRSYIYPDVVALAEYVGEMQLPPLDA